MIGFLPGGGEVGALVTQFSHLYPGIKLMSLISPALAGRSFTTSAAWETEDMGGHKWRGDPSVWQFHKLLEKALWPVSQNFRTALFQKCLTRRFQMWWMRLIQWFNSIKVYFSLIRNSLGLCDCGATRISSYSYLRALTSQCLASKGAERLITQRRSSSTLWSHSHEYKLIPDPNPNWKDN